MHMIAVKVMAIALCRIPGVRLKQFRKAKLNKIILLGQILDAGNLIVWKGLAFTVIQFTSSELRQNLTVSAQGKIHPNCRNSKLQPLLKYATQARFPFHAFRSSLSILYKLSAFLVRHIPIPGKDVHSIVILPHLECTSSPGMGMCLTWNAHPHREWRFDSPGMHIPTGNVDVPHREC